MFPICSIGWGHQNTQPSVLVPTLMAQYKFLIEKLYSSGGRKFLFLNVPPTDRSPMVIKEGPEAVKTYVTWVKAYNDGLQSMINDFKSCHNDVRFLLLYCFYKPNLAVDYYRSVRYLVLYAQDPGRSSDIWISECHLFQ